MKKYNEKFFANPSAIYKIGIESKKILEDSRLQITTLLGAHSDEIIFTSSGTESDALAIFGIVNQYKIDNKKIPHIITTNIEHPAVLENCRLLEERNEAEVTYVEVDELGIINPKKIKDVLKENTALVSVMYANNEIGTVQPIQEIAKVIRHYRKEKNLSYPFFHTDACQAMNYLPIDNMDSLGVDLLSFNSSKIYGPKGVGILYKKRNVKIAPIYTGGGQEFGLRSGTEDISAIAGTTLAFKQVCKIKNKEINRLIMIRDYGIDKILSLSNSSSYRIILNGDRKNRLPNNINISVFGISSELLVIELDAMGICVSEKSACGSKNEHQSHVIIALYKDQNIGFDDTVGSVRITLGQKTVKKDIDILVSAIEKILNKYKQWKSY
jgi:cysteine desulfurase